jgi:Trk-type K+ transport system membrane component
MPKFFHLIKFFQNQTNFNIYYKLVRELRKKIKKLRHHIEIVLVFLVILTLRLLTMNS